MDKRKIQPRAVIDIGLERDRRRKYAQSTEGNVSSQGTTPADSCSNRITSETPNFCFFESPLRMYPIDVPQRLAKSDCSSTDSVRKYSRSFSIAGSLPMGNETSIPKGHLPGGNGQYHCPMVTEGLERVFEIRRKRLRELVKELRSQAALAALLEKEASYISRALAGKVGMKGGKDIGEEMAYEIEARCGKPPGWMSSDSTDTSKWPFGFSLQVWRSLSDQDREELNRSFIRQVNGALLDAQSRKKRA